MPKYSWVTRGQVKLQFSSVQLERRADILAWLLHLPLPAVRCATLRWDSV